MPAVLQRVLLRGRVPGSTLVERPQGSVQAAVAPVFSYSACGHLSNVVYRTHNKIVAMGGENIRLSFIFFSMRFAAQGLHLPHQPLRVLALHVLTTLIVRIVEVGVGLVRFFLLS